MSDMARSTSSLQSPLRSLCRPCEGPIVGVHETAKRSKSPEMQCAEPPAVGTPSALLRSPTQVPPPRNTSYARATERGWRRSAARKT